MADSLSYLHSGRRYNVHVIKSPDINALAAPGGSIYVFSGLIGEVKSENEMAFVLAHEIGHFENRDQLRGLGRGLVLFVISLAFTGSESGLTKVAGEAIKNAQMKLSRDRERAADQFALDLIAKKYGNAAGAVSMLSRFGPLDDRYPRWLYYFITHPYYKDRISLVEKRIREMGYKAGAQLPVPAELKSHKIPKERRTLKGF
jgi:predicted Zn-dependent protease